MKILIADDETTIVEPLCRFLELKGLCVDCALDGKKALQLIKENIYDVAFLDVNMPELNGLELLKYIKKSSIETKVVFLTAYSDLDSEFCEALGVDEYLQKPMDLKVIEEIVDKYRISSEKANKENDSLDAE